MDAVLSVAAVGEDEDYGEAVWVGEWGVGLTFTARIFFSSSFNYSSPVYCINLYLSKGTKHLHVGI